MREVIRSGLTGGLLALAVAGAFVGIAPRVAVAQTLNLGGVPNGPALPEQNGAADLAATLENEVRSLLTEADARVGEGKSGLTARARVRTIAAYLLRAGAGRPWNESAPAVAGARLALTIGRIDALIDLAVAGRASRDRELAPSDAKRAIRLLDAIAAATIEQIRRAMVATSDRLPAETTRALAATLAPLVEFTALLEGAQNDDPWPVLVDARSGQPGRAAATPSASDLASRAKSLAAGGEPAGSQTAFVGQFVRSFEAALATAGAAGSAATQDLRALGLALETAEFLAAIKAAGQPYPLPEPALDAALARIEHDVRELSGSSAQDARTALEALEATLPAARAVIVFRKTDGLTDSARNALSDTAGSLLAAPAQGTDGERARARAAARISDSCATAERLEKSLAATAPRDLRDLLRQFDRDARVAVRALPQAFAAIAADPSAAGDPGNLSALDRVRSIESDRTRILALQSMIDAIGAVRPAAGRALVPVAKRMTRLLTDPLKRTEGQDAFAALESQFNAAFPFAYEEELKRRTPRATELTGGAPEKVIERAAAIRGEWCDAIGAGDFGGDASRRLDLAARLCRALRDLDQMVEPIDRAAGDKLATWGPWATRRAMIAPATQDLNARATLAARSFIAANSTETRVTFERDLAALESAIPLVQLTAALERRVSPVLRGDPDTAGAQLAPLLAVPGGNAYLAGEWPRMLALHRAMIEAEYARRTGEVKLREALSAYLAALAKEIDQAAFGAPRPVAKVRGFDGSSGDASGGADGRPNGARGRDR